MKSLDLSGMEIFLTGGAGFLGRNLNDAIINSGAIVYSVDNVSNSNTHVSLDITNVDELEKYYNHYLKGKKLHGIVNNAAVSFKSDNLTTEQFMKTIEVNVSAVYNIIKTFRPILDENASIVNIASLYGIVSPDFRIYEGDHSQYNSSAYGCSKAALIQMTKYYAAQMAPIRFNAVSPGGIYQGHCEEFVKKYSNRVPLKRMADPEEITNAVLFLLSPLSSYITGHNLIVDGGLTIW
jgi:NAD(P)-dependent dehydrogenase (short-subunit alcohol dehydrogenase family)